MAAVRSKSAFGTTASASRLTNLGRVFDLFTHIDRGLEHARGGLGIGLALSRSVVEMHGGGIEARSEGAGRGSEFLVRLPLAATGLAEAPKEAAIEPAPAPPLARRVMVVDDNRDVADSLAMLLEMMDVDVRVAYDGPSALEIATAFGRRSPSWTSACRRWTVTRPRDAAQSPERAGCSARALTGWGQAEDRRRTRETRGSTSIWRSPWASKS